MRPSQVLDNHADLLTRLQAYDGFARYLGYAAYADASANSPSRYDVDDAQTRNFVAAIKTAATGAARTALDYQVTEDMSLLVQHAANTLDETDRFFRSMPPSQSGLVFFERPLQMHDVRGKTMLVHWGLWGPVTTSGGPGLMVLLFNDRLVEPDEAWTSDSMTVHRDGTPYTAEEEERGDYLLGRWGYCGVEIMFDGQVIGPALQDPGEATMRRLYEEGVAPHQGTNPGRLMHALWLMLGQTITAATEQRGDRPARRRMARMRLPGYVTVVALRHAKHARQEGESQVEWAHRWVVRGHPRWQPRGKRLTDTHPHRYTYISGTTQACQVEGCDHTLERIWIEPYVKGPEGLPLRQSNKLYRLQR